MLGHCDAQQGESIVMSCTRHEGLLEHPDLIKSSKLVNALEANSMLDASLRLDKPCNFRTLQSV